MSTVAMEKSHLLFDDIVIKWIWKERELVHFREMWNEGISIHDIAREFQTSKRSIALLIIDQAEHKHIEQRKSGLYGEK